MSLPCRLAFATPRKLPKPAALHGNVVVLDIAFAGGTGKVSFDQITLPLIEGLGPRLKAWVDHHDHSEHARFKRDPRFELATKAQHGACPEMVTPELVARTGPVDTIVCHTDFDGIVSAAKWMRGGIEPYPGCDDDARAVDTRIGKPGPIGERMDRALRARPKDSGLFGVVVRHLFEGLKDESLWQPINEAAKELVPIEDETRRAAKRFERLAPGIAYVDISAGFARLDKTLLLLLGQEREPVSIVVDGESVSVAAGFTSGFNFLELFGLEGGMPTRVSVHRRRLGSVLKRLGAASDDVRRLATPHDVDKL